MEPLYLDHAATAPPAPEALAAFVAAAREHWANPGSLHRAGAEAALALERARGGLEQALGVAGWRTVFTATGTEANLLGLQGGARAARRRAERDGGGGPPRVLHGAAEHPCIREGARALEAEGFAVEELPVDRLGVVRPEAMAERLGPDVAAVAVQWANNELGTLNPVPELAAASRRLAPHAFFHCDAVQAAGKRPEPLSALGADAIAVAAHKLGGVRGCAALLLRPGAREPRPAMVGGGHEHGLRSGTENVMGAAAFAVAARLRAELLAREPRALLDRRARLLALLRERAPDLAEVAPAPEPELLGAILAVAFPGARARTLLTAMEARGVYVGSGSACHGGGQSVSPVLQAIGFAPELAGSVLRFSLSGAESEADLLRAADALAAARAELAASPAARG